jgi:ribosome-binding ATPase
MRDVEIINTELIIADLEQVERNVQQLEKRLKAQDKDSVKLYPILKRICDVLKSGGLIYSMVDELTEEERMLLKPYNLLTNKPFVYAINIGTEDFADADKIKKEFEDKLQRPVAIVCAKLESEMLGFTAEERAEYVEAEFGESYVPTLDSLISLAYDTVGLMYYFTTGEKETRAWTIKKNSTAPEAAAAIHNDFQKKFIKAEVVSCDNFIAA